MQQLVSNEPFCPARLSFHWNLWEKRRWKWKSDKIYTDKNVQGDCSKTKAPKTVKQGGQHSGSGSIQDLLETEVAYAKQNITIYEYNSPTLNILIWSLPVCSAHSSSWSFPALPRCPNIKTYWRLLLSTLSVVFYVFPVWNHTSRSFTCTWPWNTASIFFSLTLPLQRFLGAHVKRLSADNYLRHLGGPSVPQRTSTFTLCGRGPSIPDTPAFVVVMAAAKKDGVMLFVVVTAHSFFFLIFVLILPDPLLKNTWSLRSGCCDQRVCARLFDRVGHDQMSRGWVLVLLAFFLLALHQQRQTDFMSNVSHEGKIKCLGVMAAKDLRWGGFQATNGWNPQSASIHPLLPALLPYDAKFWEKKNS